MTPDEKAAMLRHKRMVLNDRRRMTDDPQEEADLLAEVNRINDLLAALAHSSNE